MNEVFGAISKNNTPGLLQLSMILSYISFLQSVMICAYICIYCLSHPQELKVHESMDAGHFSYSLLAGCRL